ncbi:golgin subfamily B member 1-like [Xiphias gladius]|uniref:golgin subfamily B member 1-like n=1 Tax=Xiphias gladius TaxID=8245 RepID=UPI001A990921|nr:golgin subfamily B member 1-like [Xiphias gladius]
MAKSREHVATFLEEFSDQVITGVRSPGATVEAWIPQQPTPITEALTPQEQMRALFHVVEEGTSQSKADLEQRQQNSTMVNIKKLEDKQTKVNMKTNMETIKRQRQLTCQVMEVIEQHWEKTQRERNEIGYLRTKIEQQQEDIDRLTAEKHDQYLVIKTLRLKIENVFEKLEDNKNESTQEKMQLLKIQAEIYQERETLDRRRNEIISERRKLEMIKYDKTRQESKEPKETMVKREEEIMERLMADSLLSAVNKNKKIMLEAKQAKEQIEKNLEDIKQELKRNTKDISQHRDQIEHIKHNMNVNIIKIKQRWTKIQRDIEMQKATVAEMERRERETKGIDTFDNVKVRVSRIFEEMEKLWDVLEGSEQQLGVTLRERHKLHTETSQMENMKSESQKQQQDMDVSMKVTQWETLMKADMQRQKRETENKLVKMKDRFDDYKINLYQVDRTREINQRKENQFEEDNMEMSIKNKADMQRMIFEVQEIREMLRMVREDPEKRIRVFTEDKSQNKWRNFQEKKQRRKLEQWLEKIIKERDELEIVKVKIQQQREEGEQKLEDTITTILTMGEIKVNIENAATEINNVQEEMLKAQRNMEMNKEEVRKYMDKLTSMKAQVSRWILTESAIKKTFSVNTSKLQEPRKETHRETLKDKTLEIPTDQERAADEITKRAMSLQQSITLEDQHQSDKIKEQEHRQSKHKQFFAVDINEKQSIFLQIQREIHEENLIDDDQTELIINVRQNKEVEKQISKLKEKEEKIRDQIKCAMENMEEKNQEIKRLIMDINDLQSQKPETETGLKITVRETGNVEEGGTGLLQETEQRESILWVKTNVFKHEMTTYEDQIQKDENGNNEKKEITDESDLIKLNVEKQKQSQQSKKDQQTHTEQMDGGFDKKDTGSADIQRLMAEIYKTQKIVRLVKKELKIKPEKINVDKDHKDEGRETEGLLQFKEFLKMVKTETRQNEMHLKEELSNMKMMKTAAKKQKRELDQRLEKTLRERDKLDILKIKMQRQTEVIEEKLEKMAKVKSTVEKMAVKTRKKSEDIQIIMKETEVKLRQLEDINYKIKATKHDLKSSYLLICQEGADLEKFKNQIRQKRNGESPFENTEREKGDIKKYEKAEIGTEWDKLRKNRMGKEMEEMENEILRLRSDKDRVEEDIKLITDSLDQKNSETVQLKNSIIEQVKHITKREKTEMLKQQIQVERENVKKARQQAEAEIHEINHLREFIKRQKQDIDDRAQTTKTEIREIELLKSELEIKRKEGEQIFRKNITMRERDELEVLRIKLQQKKQELAEEEQSTKNLTTLIQEYREYEKQSLDPKQVRTNSEISKMVHQSSKVTDSITDPQNVTQKIHVHLEIITREMGILENVNVHLGKQREGLKALKGENKTVRDNMIRISSQIKMGFEKLTIQAEAEMDETVQMRADIQKQKQELDIRLEKVKRERREMELLKSELEFKKRENQQMIRKGIQKDQDYKKILAEIKEEKDALKRETRKRKKELNQQLERIIRERDELEIIKLKMQREKYESRGGTEQLRVSYISCNVANKIQKYWELIHICMEKCKHMKKHSEDLNGAIKNEKENIKAQAKIIIQERKEVEIIKMDIRRQKEMMICALKNIQQKQTHLEQMEINIKKEQNPIEKEKEKYIEKSEGLVLREKGLGNDKEFLKAESLILKVGKQKQKKVLKEIKRLINNTSFEKGLEIPETKRKLIQTRTDEPEEIKKEVQCGKKKQKEEEVNLMSEIQEKISSDEQKETLMLQLKEPLEKDIKEKKDILKEELQLCGKLDTTPGKDRLQSKKKLGFEFKVSDHDNSNKDKDLKHLAGTKKLRKKRQLKLSKIKDGINKKTDQLDKDEQHDEEAKVMLQIKKNGKEKTEEVESDEKLQKSEYTTELLKKGLIRLSDVVIEKEDVKEDWKPKVVKNEGHEKLKMELKQEREDLDALNETMNKERKDLELMRSDILKQTDLLEQEKQHLKEERQKSEITKTELQKEKEHAHSLLDEIDREKTNIKDLFLKAQKDRNKLENVINKITLKQIEQEHQDDSIKRLKQELESSEKNVLPERKEVEVLRKNLKKTKEQVCATMKSISRERERLSQTTTDINREREMLLNEKGNLEREKSELKIREHQVSNQMEVMESLTVKLQQLSERMSDNIKSKMEHLQQNNEDVLRVYTALEEKFAELDEQKENMACYTELVEREKEGLISILSEIIIQKEDTENLWKQKFKTEKLHLEKLKVELKEDREDLDRVNEMMNKDQMDLELKRSDILKQTALLEQDIRDLKDEKEKFQITKTELQKNKEHADSLFDEIKREKANIQDLTLQVQTERNKLQNAINIIALKQKEQELKDNDIKRQTRELQTRNKSVLAEREELDVLKKDLNRKKDEHEAVMSSISEEKEKLSQLKTSLDMDRQKLMNDKDKMAAGLSDLKVREDQFMSEILSIQTLRGKLKELNEKTRGQIKNKTYNLDQSNEKVQRLCFALEQKLADFDQVTTQMPVYTELIQTEKNDLIGILSEMVMKREVMENQWKHKFEMEKQNLEKQRAELKQDREDLDALNETMNKERKDLELMRSDILKQTDLLEQEKQHLKEERQKSEITKTELQKNKEHADSLFDEIKREKANIQDLTLQVQTERNKLQNAINIIALKQKEQELKDNDIKRQTRELQTRNKSVLAEREELDVLKKDLNKKKDEHEAAMSSISEEKEKLSQLKTSLDMDRQKLMNDKDKMAAGLSDLKVREDQFMSEILSIQTLRGKLKELNEKTRGQIKNKTYNLDQSNEKVQRLCFALEQKLADFDQVTTQMPVYTELIQTEKNDLIGILSEMVMKREVMENQWKHKFEMEKQNLEKQRAELKQDREDLDALNEMMNKDQMDLELKRSDILKQTALLEQDIRDLKDEKEKFQITKTELQKNKEHADSLFDEIKREKANIQDLTLQVQTERNKLQNAINIIALKQKEQELKDNDIKRQTRELQTRNKSVLAEREELDVLKKDLNRKKDEHEAVMSSISEEKEKLSQLKTSLDMDRQKLMNDKDKMAAGLSDLKVREDQFMSEILSIQTLRGKLKELNEKTRGQIKNKTYNLDQSNEKVQRLCFALEQKLADFDQVTTQMPVYTELIQTEKNDLIGILSEMVMKREVMENQWKHKFEMEKQNLEKQRAELKQDREDLDALNEMMNKDQMDLELKRSDILKQTALLEQDIRDLKDEKEKFQITKTELQKNKEHADSLFDEIKREKANIQDLTLQVQTERNKLQNAVNIIALKQKEQELKDNDIKRQTRELQTRNKSVLAEREELDVLKKDLNKKKDEHEAAMSSISEEKEKLSQLKISLDMDRQKLMNDKDKMAAGLSDLKVREDQFMSEILSIQTLRGKLKELNEKTRGQIKNKTYNLDQSNEKVQRLCFALEQKLADFDQVTTQMPVYTELIQTEKNDLIGILSEMVMKREVMENQWKHKFEMEKQNLEKQRAELKQDREDLDALNEMMNKDQMDLELKRSDILKQTALLEQDIRDLKDERVQTERNKLQNAVNIIALKQKEQELKDNDIKRQTRELQTRNKSVLAEREELDVLKKDLNKKKDEHEAAMSSISEEKEKLSQLKTSLDMDRQKLMNDKDKMAAGLSDLKVREDQFMSEILSIQTLRGKLKELNEKTRGQIKNKTYNLDQSNEKVQRLCFALEQKLADFDQVTTQMPVYTELIQTEKNDLIGILSEMVMKREVMENQWKHKFEMEKQNLEKQRAELKQDREDLDALNETMNKERKDLELMRSDILKQTNLLEQDKQHLKEERQKSEITKTELQKEKEHADSPLDEIDGEKTLIKDLMLKVQTGRNKLENVINKITLKQIQQEYQDDNIRRLKQELESSEKNVLAERKEVEVLRKNLKKTKEEVYATMKSLSREKERLSQTTTDIDREREMLLIESKRLAGELNDLKVKEDQFIIKMKSLDTVRAKLKLLNERKCKDMKNIIQRVEENNNHVLKLCTLLDQKCVQIDEEKDKMFPYNKMFQREKEVFISLISDIFRHIQEMKGQQKPNVEVEIKDCERVNTGLTQEREDPERWRKGIKKEKLDLELMRSDIVTHINTFEQNVKEKRNRLEIEKIELQSKKDNSDFFLNEINQEKTNIKHLTLQVQTERNKLKEVMKMIALKSQKNQIKNDEIQRQFRELELLKMNHNKRKQEDIISEEREQLIQMKFNADKEREMLLNEMDKIEDVSEVKTRKNTVESVITLRAKLKELNQKIIEDITHKLRKLEQSQKYMQKLCTVLEQKLKEDLERVNEQMNKLNLKMMRSVILKETNISEQEKQDINEENEKLEIKKLELQSKKISIDCLLDEMNQEQLYQMRATIESEREMFLNGKKGMKDKLSELKIRKEQLTSVMNSMGSLRANLKQLYQRTREYLDRLEHKNEDILQMNSILENKYADLDKQKNIITGYYYLIQREKKHGVLMNFDKAVQTEIVAKESLQEHDIEKQDLNKIKEFECEKDVLQSDVMIQTEVFEHQWKLKEDKGDLERKGKYSKMKRGVLLVGTEEEVENEWKQKLATISESVVEQNDFTDEKMSKRDCLRKIWKNTKMERKEIDQMRSRGHEMRNNLEKRLKEINQFVKRTWLQKQKVRLENTKLEQGLGKNTTSKTDWERDHKILEKKYDELGQIKIQMLSEIEKLHVKEKVTRGLTACDKANQTFQVHITTGDEAAQAMQQASTKMHEEQMKVEETQAASETSSALLSQLLHYCCHCWLCCACCKQAYPEKK